MGTEDGPDPARNAVLHANQFRVDAMIEEGPDAGRRCAIIRLGGCNLTCEGCDQPSTWGSPVTSRPVRVGAFLDRLDEAGRKTPINRVLITGGEPLLQQEGPAMQCLVEGCVDVGRTVHIETNGTTTPAPWLKDLEESGRIRWRVAPKIFGPMATDPIRRRLYRPALRWFAKCSGAEFLFPCEDESSIDMISAFCVDYELSSARVWAYPMATDSTDAIRVSRLFASAALRAGFNVSTRLGVIMIGR